ncbi:MAG: D-tyrosyl-tRNA(Tyr) deacylase [Clostridiales bacterium]|nr:D-tyrosyl-tRNA(Tyr) deacylase [Clostridiales bacterium]
MRAVIQRVLDANLKVDGKLVSEIGKGYVIFLGVKKGDTKEDADYFIKKIPPLRICEDENGKINKSIIDVGGEILLVSQFTLFADTSHGNRPSFLDAEAPDKANQMYEYVAEGLRAQGLIVKQGVFGADMKINQTNDGPFTVILEKPQK